MSRVYVAGIGLCAPGLAGWEASRRVLAGAAPFLPEPPRLTPPALLAPNERRRAGTVVRLALRVAGEAADMAGLPASAHTQRLRQREWRRRGDPRLARGARPAGRAGLADPVPQFRAQRALRLLVDRQRGDEPGHLPRLPGRNRRRRAAQGGGRGARWSAARCCSVCYDAPVPPPLAAMLGVDQVFGAALVLLPEPGPQPLARLDVTWSAEPAPEPVPSSAGFRPLCDTNPSARILPLLEALARGEPGRLALPAARGQHRRQPHAMLDRLGIAALIPHQGSMCLLDGVLSWDASRIACRACSHLDAANPLRQHGRLGAVSGIEYGLQAAALHGALSAGAPQPPGFLAALRAVALRVPRLDNPAFGVLQIAATAEGSDSGGQAYSFRLTSEHGMVLVEGRCLIALPRRAVGRKGDGTA